MTTEDDFQAAMDSRVFEWQLRLVFADWLDERADPRAEGYRALGLLRRRPFQDGYSWYWAGTKIGSRARIHLNPYRLGRAWHQLVSELSAPRGIALFGTRREAEEAAALAFQKLSWERRRELLS